MISDTVIQSATELYRTFVDQNVEVVYGTICCGRIHLGVRPASKCRTCPKIPKVTEIRSQADLEQFLKA